MRTDTERIVLLHARAQRLEDQKKMRIWGSVSLCLFAVLLAALVQTDVPFQSIVLNIKQPWIHTDCYIKTYGNHKPKMYNRHIQKK